MRSMRDSFSVFKIWPQVGDGPGIDHRIERRAPIRLQSDRVESLPRGLHADSREQMLLATVFQGQPIGDGFGDGLNGERLARIAHLVEMPVTRGDADAAPVRIRPRQLRDVIGDLPVGEVCILGVNSLKALQDRRFHSCVSDGSLARGTRA
jgi:hypothetical protein